MQYQLNAITLNIRRKPSCTSWIRPNLRRRNFFFKKTDILPDKWKGRSDYMDNTAPKNELSIVNLLQYHGGRVLLWYFYLKTQKPIIIPFQPGGGR